MQWTTGIRRKFYLLPFNFISVRNHKFELPKTKYWHFLTVDTQFESRAAIQKHLKPSKLLMLLQIIRGDLAIYRSIFLHSWSPVPLIKTVTFSARVVPFPEESDVCHNRFWLLFAARNSWQVVISFPFSSPIPPRSLPHPSPNKSDARKEKLKWLLTPCGFQGQPPIAPWNTPHPDNYTVLSLPWVWSWG